MEKDSPVQLVTTLPEPHASLLAYEARSRTTVGVLTQLLTQSRRRVVICAPFIQEGRTLAEGIIADSFRTALKRGVTLEVVSTGAGLRVFADSALAASNSLRLFQPSVNLANELKLGCHAKFCVADGQSAYIGSANLTGPGLLGQVELGVLVHGEIARQIERFWDVSVELGLFVCIS